MQLIAGLSGKQACKHAGKSYIINKRCGCNQFKHKINLCLIFWGGKSEPNPLCRPPEMKNSNLVRDAGDKEHLQYLLFSPGLSKCSLPMSYRGFPGSFRGPSSLRRLWGCLWASRHAVPEDRVTLQFSVKLEFWGSWSAGPEECVTR